MSISLFLPLKTTDDSTYAQNLQRAQLLLVSLVKFCTFATTLTICTPADQQAAAQAVLASSGNVTVAFVNDEAIVPGITASTAKSWFKAQILKMAFVAQATTDYVLVLDPDVVATKNFAETDLVTALGIYNNKLVRKQSHLVIYNNAVGLLLAGLQGISPLGTKPAKQPYLSQVNTKLLTMYLTPAIYKVTTMQALIAALAAKQVTLLPLALTGGWTIESLYTTYAQLNSLFMIQDADLVGTHYNVDGSTDNSNLFFDPSTGIFSFISSRLGITANQASFIWRVSVGDLSGLPTSS
jgi:hypothetical protein